MSPAAEGTVADVLAGRARYAVVCGDATAVLASLPDDCAHVTYCDPGYGLSQIDTADVVACLTAWLAGKPYVHKAAGFMGHEWDSFVPGPEAWREVHRALRPGGYCVAFSSTRTVDLLGIAVGHDALAVRYVNERGRESTEVLILDEPANGLDPEGIAWLRSFLRYLASEGRTVLVSSHVLSEVEQTVDDVVMLDLAYAPPFSSAKDPVNMLGYMADKFPVFGYRFSELTEVDLRRWDMGVQFPCLKTHITDEDKLRDVYDRLAYGGTPHDPKAPTND